MSENKASPGKNPGAPAPPRRVLTARGTRVQVGRRQQQRARKLIPESTAFLPPKNSSAYEDYIQPATQGLVKPLINGRNSNGTGPDIDLTEPLDEMESTVQQLGAGDFVFLSAWFFDPATPLTTGFSFGISTWGQLLAQRAQAGVTVKILINDFDPVSGMDAWLDANALIPLKKLVEDIPEGSRDNFKYTVSLHPAHVGGFKTTLAGLKAGKAHVASHHQKFMLAKKSDELVAFCGGLDIEQRKAHQKWSYAGLTGWHDIHFRLEGPIAYDLEREFVERWNREKGKSPKNPTVKGWKSYATLARTPISAKDNASAKKVHKVQMLRTVSGDATFSSFSTERDDIRKVYVNVVHGAKDYLYLENQYFRDQKLADAIAGRARANSELTVVFVVVFSAGDDDGANPVTAHGDHLQHTFFKKVTDAMGTRCGIFSMAQRAVHSKMMIADDAIIVGGSANGNTRSFELDSELNISVEDSALTLQFRKRLWAHNLGQPQSAVADATKMKALFAAAAATNASAAPKQMVGEGIIEYDFTKTTGSKSFLVPDAFAYVDFDDLADPQGEGLDVRGGGTVA